MTILVSACLLGLRCRYDGRSKPNSAVLALGEKHRLIPCCPEQLGGLPTPRSPAEWQGERIMNKTGEDVTAQYLRGGEEAVRLARTLGCEAAILKERSPACGSREIYDGSFSGVLVPGQGSAAAALRAAGIPVYGESELDRLR
jgi:uncharacterized protein YbbK (DUF523 family)